MSSLSSDFPIRSFTCRSRPLKLAQQQALENLYADYGVAADKLLNLNALFNRTAPKQLEIGFGKGEALIAMAKAHPENDYLGIEVHRPGIAAVLMAIQVEKLTNIRVIEADAVSTLQCCFTQDTFDNIYLFFPDPWPKRRHHKRRLVQASFVQLIADRLKPNGYFHLATDWEHYAQQMVDVLEHSHQLRNVIAPATFSPRPAERPLTRFEQRGHRLGHLVWDLLYTKI